MNQHPQSAHTVFLDVDTQIDFLFPAGALFVPDAEALAPALTSLTRFASANNILILSTVDAHTEDDPEFKTWKPHCVAGTDGQRKAACTLITPRPPVLTTSQNGFEQMHTQVAGASQIIVEKQHLDVFTNPNFSLLMQALKADRFIVYGVVTEYCVGSAALGLLKAGASVELVTDSIKSLDETEERDFISRFRAMGGRLTSVATVTA